jgi:hypothetical protein
MKGYLSLVMLAVVTSSIVWLGCSSDPILDSLAIKFNKAAVTTEKVDGKPTVTGEFEVQLVNRTERSMIIAFLEGTIVDAKTNLALVRFIPIIPNSYGSSGSKEQLIPKQAKAVTVVTPQGLDPFDAASSPIVIVKLSFQTTDGYRTDVVSQQVQVLRK